LNDDVNAEGRRYMLMDSIIDHRKDENGVPQDDEYVVVTEREAKGKPLMDGKSTSNGRMSELAGSPSKR
jgi:hypothetical protein